MAFNCESKLQNRMKLRDFSVKILRKLIYPVLPPRSRLPFLFRIHQIAGTIEPELRYIESVCSRRTVAIDIGANIGLWSYRLAGIFDKVYAFEINEGVAADLVAYHSRKVEVIHSGLSSGTAELTLYIPVSKGVPLLGWASLRPGNCPDAETHITKTVNVRPLDSFSFTEVAFIKIDVEGHEVEVLKGAEKTITANQPVVLVEVKAANSAAVDSFFRGVRYREVTLLELAGVEGAAENRIYVPAETKTGKR